MPDRKPYANPHVESAIRSLERDFEDAFRELERYLTDALEELHAKGKLIEHDVYNARTIRDTVSELQAQARKLGFGDVLDNQANRLAGLAKQIAKEAGAAGLPRKFKGADAEDIKSLLFGAQRELLADETRVARDLERILLRSTTGAMRMDDLVANVRKALDLNQRQALTKAEDTIASFHTQTRVAHYTTGGVVWWLYDGPQDERNRGWCGRFVGTRVTIEVLNRHAASFGRKHPLPPSLSLGGYGCRHQLIPLVDNWERYPEGPR